MIDAMPVLPMLEIHKPRVLDAAAEVLLAAGLADQAAFALGRAGASEFHVSTVFPREPRLEVARTEIERRLGYEEATRLIAEGRAATVDAALGQIRDWLRRR